MAGKHVGGSDSLGFLIDGLTAGQIEHFMPKNDKAYAEGRKGFVDGLLITGGPYGTEANSISINQHDAWFCWTHGWNLRSNTPGFQLETAVADA